MSAPALLIPSRGSDTNPFTTPCVKNRGEHIHCIPVATLVRKHHTQNHMMLTYTYMHDSKLTTMYTTTDTHTKSSRLVLYNTCRHAHSDTCAQKHTQTLVEIPSILRYWIPLKPPYLRESTAYIHKGQWTVEN